MTQAIDKLNGRCKEFAEACYNMSSIEELKELIKLPVDRADCEEWEITATEWKKAVFAALYDRLQQQD